YFYRKDNTPGCTKEACEFRDLMPEFDKLGAEVEVLGVSPDSEKSHTNFVSKFDLNFTLLSDPPAEKGAPPPMCNAYGVWQEKKMYGRTSMGIVRTTYIIGPDQTVLHRFDKVKAAGHAEKVLEWIRNNAAAVTG
ncbi:MAG: peroxiredoxin, partial [Planctomycetota bacterium]